MKKPYLLAVVSLLLIPLALASGAALFSAINPEVAAGHANYERNYQLLALLQSFFALAGFLASALLWLLCCFFLLKAKQRSYRWMLAAIFGPFGLIALTMLGDKAPASEDRYRQVVGKLHVALRVVYEAGLFMAVWTMAYQAMVLKRDLLIEYESATTGVPAAQIIDLQNASSGMYAFGEGLEVMYLVVLMYLLWPVVFNAVACLPKVLAAREK